MPQGASSYHTNTNVIGLIMAGGRSERMRLSFGPQHKSLVTVLGVTLLERNICAFVARGICRIVVAISERDAEVHQYVQHYARRLFASAGGTLECLKEVYQLGTIGAASELAKDGCELVVVANVDNLTTLDWNQMLAFHRQKRAAMTVAAHRQPFRSPFGELTVEKGNVVRYDEKPMRPIFISSGCYILAGETCRLIAKGQRTDAPDLVKALLAGGHLVAAYEHESAWIDINDAESVAAAERLVARHFTDFGCWHPSPHCERTHLLVIRDNHVLATSGAGHDAPAELDLPWCMVEGHEAQASAAAACRRIGLGDGSPRLLGSYDDEDSGLVTRRHIFLFAGSPGALPPNSGTHCWISLEHSERDGRMSSVMSRAVSLLKNLS